MASNDSFETRLGYYHIPTLWDSIEIMMFRIVLVTIGPFVLFFKAEKLVMIICKSYGSVLEEEKQ